MKQTFYSNGKLLITGEYLVLNGAKALALPTKFGQNLIIEPAQNKTFYWTSYDADGTIWFEAEITFETVITKKQSQENKIEDTLIEILHEAYNLNPNFINNSQGYKVTTELTFPKFWGLGTSSTLINNIAQWLQINPYKLLKKTFGGSGYDIACAQNDSALLYQLENQNPKIEPIIFHPTFSENIYFIYLNKKQSSKSAIASYYKKQVSIGTTITIIDSLTEIISTTNDIQEFTSAIKKHEIEMSKVLEISTVQETLFADFDGVIKSLGAWGGDFVMAITKENPTEYFLQKGYETILPYQDMIL